MQRQSHLGQEQPWVRLCCVSPSSVQSPAIYAAITAGRSSCSTCQSSAAAPGRGFSVFQTLVERKFSIARHPCCWRSPYFAHQHPQYSAHCSQVLPAYRLVRLQPSFLWLINSTFKRWRGYEILLMYLSRPELNNWWSRCLGMPSPEVCSAYRRSVWLPSSVPTKFQPATWDVNGALPTHYEGASFNIIACQRVVHTNLPDDD